MFKAISNQIQWQEWEKNDPRFCRLELLDRLQDGAFYEHLPHSFYEEMRPGTTEYIPIDRRRPSSQYNICGLISKIAARKMFAGRHAPRLVHDNEKLLVAINALLQQGEVMKKMVQLAYWGAVGSAAMTFKIVEQSGKFRLVCNTWRAKYGYPIYDAAGDLLKLCIKYVLPGHALIAKGLEFDNIGQPINPNYNYWFMMDFTPDKDCTYFPIYTGAPAEERVKVEIDHPEWTFAHKVGITQAHWFENLSGGMTPDGAATFQYAIPMQIDLDYTLSQLGAAIRYNASPQLLVVGDVRNYNNNFSRSPANTLHMNAENKDGDGGMMTGRGDAKLLEMTGNGIRTGLEHVKTLRKFALEVCSAVRKDPEQLKGALAAKAMELIDEEMIDLVMELRTSYGECGYLPQTKKMAKIALRAGHPLMKGVKEEEIDTLTLEWPRMYTPTPSEVQQLAQAMELAVGGKPAGGGPNAGPVSGPVLIDLEDAKNYLATHIDLHVAPGSPIVPEDETATVSDADNLPAPPGLNVNDPSGGLSVSLSPYPNEPTISPAKHIDA